MTTLSRAVALAAMTLTFFGMGATGTAGRAAETVATTTTPLPVTIAPNVLTASTVPALVATNAEIGAAATAAATVFVSLAAAVAAHDAVDDAASEELHCLASAIYYEAKGEPLQGQLGVAEVIINRAASGRFRGNVCSVVTQKGQFSFVRGGHIPAIDQSRAAYRTALAIARVARADAWNSPADTALYFNGRRAPAAGLRRIATIGNHNFYR